MPVKLRVAQRVRRITVELNGRRAGVRLGRRSRGLVGATVRGLRRGHNHLAILATGRNGWVDSAHRELDYAARRRGLVRLRVARRSHSPLAVAVRIQRRTARFAAWLNGRRVSYAFGPTRRHADRSLVTLRQASLSASDGLRYGRNRLRVLVVADSRRGARTRFQVANRTIRVPRRLPLVGAGRDQHVSIGRRVVLDGRASRPAKGGERLRYRWRLSARPRGSHARLRRAGSARPRLRPDRLGTYRVSLVTRGQAAGTRAAASQSSPPDTVTLAASEPYPLIELATLVPAGGSGCTAVSVRLSQVGAQPTPYQNPSCAAGGAPAIHAVALNRSMLALSANQSFRSYAELENWVKGLQNDVLVVIEVPQSFIQASGYDAKNFNAAATKLGAQGFDPPGDANLVVAGVPGWPAGAGFQNGSQTFPSGQPLNFFLVQDVHNNYGVLPRGYAAYDTAVSGAPGTMTIAGRSYSMGACADPNRSQAGCGPDYYPYFHVVVVRADDPSALVSEHAYGVDTVSCVNFGQECTYDAEQHRMATDLASLAGDPSRLVFVQGVNQPYRYAGDQGAPASNWWYSIANQLDRLGGTAHVFNTAPTTFQAGSLSDYAAVGGQAVVDEDRSVPVEVSGRIPDAWTGGQGQGSLQGVLHPNHNGWYTPVTDKFSNDSTLQEIALAPPSEWPDMDTGEVQAYNWLVKNKELSIGEDIRTAYYDNDSIDWAARKGTLQGLPYPGDQRTCSDQPGTQTTNPGFTRQEYCAVNAELQQEFQWVADVSNYFVNVAQPFQQIQGKTHVDIQQLVSKIETAVDPPGSASTTLTDVLNIFSLVVGAFNAGDIDVGLQIALNGSSAAFGIAGLFTDGANLDPVAAAIEVEAQELETTINNDIEATLGNLARLRDIVVADYAKLSQVAANVEGTWTWNTNVHDAAVDRLSISTQRTSDEALLGAAGTVFQVYPYDFWQHNSHAMTDATQFECFAGGQPNDRPFDWPFPSPPSGQARLQLNAEAYPNDREAVTAAPPWSFLVYRVEVGVETQANGSPAPKSLTDQLFRPPAPDGVYEPVDPTQPQNTPNAGFGFYAPWLYGRALDPVHFDCNNWDPDPPSPPD